MYMNIIKTGNKKAQASMMEYIIMTLFMVIIIIAFIFMLLGTQFLSISAESSEEKIYRSMSLLKSFSKAPLFTKDNTAVENPVFYDEKLTALMLSDDSCEMLENLFGSLWSMEIVIIEDTGTQESGILCDISNYNNDCNKWVFCEIPAENIESIITREVPVSVYKKSADRTYAALMLVSTYE